MQQAAGVIAIATTVQQAAGVIAIATTVQQAAGVIAIATTVSYIILVILNVQGYCRFSRIAGRDNGMQVACP